MQAERPGSTSGFGIFTAGRPRSSGSKMKKKGTGRSVVQRVPSNRRFQNLKRAGESALRRRSGGSLGRGRGRSRAGRRLLLGGLDPGASLAEGPPVDLAAPGSSVAFTHSSNSFTARGPSLGSLPKAEPDRASCWSLAVSSPSSDHGRGGRETSPARRSPNRFSMIAIESAHAHTACEGAHEDGAKQRWSALPRRDG